MEHTSVDDLENTARTADVQKPLSNTLSLGDMAMNYFELGPGDSLSGGLHTHMNQEEVFYVLEGTATFETKEETVDVAADEIIRFAPGEYQEGRNETEERVRVLAMGAPKEAGETRTLFPCQECDSDYQVVEMGEDGFTLVCPDCGTEVEL